MSKYSQGSFPRLAVVGSHDKKKQQRQAASRWWCSKETGVGFSNPERTRLPGSRRTIVMPSLSRRWMVSILWATWNFVRSYLVTGPAHARRGTVLVFRSEGLRAHRFRPAQADESFPGKKASGRVHWQGDHAAAPQEEGRG